MTRTTAALLVAIAAVPGVASASPGGSTGYVAAPSSAFVPTPHGGLVSDIIFINRCTGCPGPTCGCVFMKSSISDATSNQTIIGGVDDGTAMTVTEFSHPQEVWDELMTCIRAVYSPYDVIITDVDPGQVPHHEAVVAGRGRDMMLQGVGGIAPLDSGTCEPQNNVISFSFANQYGGTVAGLSTAQQICWTVAQESAHAFGLDHALDCTDPLTYLYTSPSGGSCGTRYFRNKLVDCGEDVARPCVCGGNKQNSHAKLLAVHGMGTIPPPPTVEVTMPVDGATVAAGTAFSVTANVVEPRGVNRVEVLINGHEWTEVEGQISRNAYLLPVPAQVPDGVLRGCNDLDACATDRITVTKGVACATADTCAAGQRCDAGRCLWDPPVGAQGDACTYPEYCTSGVCADIGDGELACTESCFGGPNDQCPDGYECAAATGQMGVCAPPPIVDGCCLSDAGRSGGRQTLAVNLGLGGLVGLLVLRRRRRQRRVAGHARQT
jgi:hypothetical protein